MDESNGSKDGDRRKTGGGVWLSHKVIGFGGGGLVASLALIAQLNKLYVPIEKGHAQDQQISQLRLDLSTVKNDLVETVNRGNDKIIDRIKESEERSSKTADSYGRRIDSLEALLRIKPAKSNN